eukprot:75080_1
MAVTRVTSVVNNSVLSNKRKRPLFSADNSQFVFNTERFQPPTKKQKLPIDAHIYKQTVFPNQHDQLQYISLSESIQCSALVQTLHIPLCIIQTVAEYGTGIVEDCDNCECENQIVRLHQDTGDEHVVDKHYRRNKYEYYFCTECMKHTQMCGCGEWKLVNTYTRAICVVCNHQVTACTEFCGHRESLITQCYECEGPACYDCHNYCRMCHNTICLHCFDKDGIEKRINDGAQYSLHKQHQNCRMSAVNA